MTSAVTKKQMGMHAGVSYCVQLTKVKNLYFPRVVILLDDPLIIEACEILWIFRVPVLTENPFKIAECMAIGAIDAVNDSGARPIESQSIDFLEKRLIEERKILAGYKADRAALRPITEEFKNRTMQAADNVKLLQCIIKNHYMSERYAGRTST